MRINFVSYHTDDKTAKYPAITIFLSEIQWYKHNIIFDLTKITHTQLYIYILR